jgi:lantibiotic modifying enzyme
MLFREEIQEKITAIEADLSGRYNEVESLGLFTGTSGCLIFYYYLHKLTKEPKHLEKFYEILDAVYDRLSTDSYPNTYCDGLTGIAMTIDFFRKKGMIEEEDVKETLEIFDDILLNAAAVSINKLDEYDFLHGEFGVLFYLNERIQSNPDIAVKLIPLFETAAKMLHSDITSSQDGTNMIPQPNFGMAHGNMSYIVIFSKFLQQFPDNVIVREALKTIVEHQLQFKSNDPASYALFPSIVNDRLAIRHDTVLGWCYGDQPVALGLKMAGTVLNDQAILNQAYEIASHTGKRNTVTLASKTEVTDAGLCHGISSVALNNKLLYDWTGEQVFYDNYVFFTGKVLERGNHPSTASGFRRYYGNDKYEDVIAFLDGTAGIGVFLISTLLEEDTDWEQFFLLK